MKSLHRSSSAPARTAFRLDAALAVLACASAAFAQTTPELKVPRPLPAQNVDDKAPAPLEEPAPVFPATSKESAPAGATASAQSAKIPEHLARRSRPELSRVHTRAPDADGVIWARGSTWKARFDGSGASFIPILEPCAPKSYPIDFSIASIEVGGTLLDFDPSAAPAISDTRVSFDRGSVVERYDLSLGSIEQSFVFETLPAGGDLVVRIAVASELQRSVHGEGLRFENEHGQVAYGKATVFDADGRSTGAGPELAGDVVELRVPASFLATAAFPIVVDPMVSTFNVDTSSFNNYLPDVAYDVSTNRYLIVYEEALNSTDHDVYAQLVDGNGGGLIGGYVDATTDYWCQPRVANNNIADQFLVVCQASIDGVSPWIVTGALVSAVSGSIGGPFDISGFEAGDKLRPVVGGDPNPSGPTWYCVVWERVFSSTDRDILYNLVTSSGTVVGNTLSVDNSGSTYDGFPAISKSDGTSPAPTQAWNVVWLRDQGGPGHDIRGAQIAWHGAISTASFPIDSSPSDDIEVSVSSPDDDASGLRDWVVAYTRLVGGDYDITLKNLRGGTVLGEVNLSALESAAGSGTFLQNQARPYVDSDGSKFLVAYIESFNGSSFDYDVWIASTDVVGSTLRLTEGHQNLTSSSLFDGNSRITTTRSGGGGRGRALVAWERFTTSFNDGNIHAALYDAPTFQSFCFPGIDTAACPCGNAPSGPGRGCNNSANTGGGMLFASGSPETDTVVFHASSMKPSSASIFLQGNAVVTGGLAFGDGVRCAAGTIKRLYTKNASTGSASAPVGSDPSVKARSAALGDVIVPGTTRWYQVYSRDPANYACPAPATFNTTSGIVVDWL